jgi:methyl-accepting chemotaxis protein
MDSMTQQNAALVEEAAAAAQSLQDQASELAHVVSIFKLVEGEEVHVRAPSTIAAAPAATPAKAAKAVALRVAARPALRKPVAAAAAAPAAKPKKVASAAAGNDEWEEF